MKTHRTNRRDLAMTLPEVLIVLGIVSIFALMYVASLPKQHRRAPQIQCINNVKQIGLAASVWEGDHNNRYPPQESATNGGSMEYGTGLNVWRHFQVMSNELSTPKVVICPADSARFSSTNFDYFCNSNVSFFFGIEASETNPMMFLSGDRNLTNGTSLNNAILDLTTNRPSGWTAETHKKFGNIALSDGSVMQTTNLSLRAMIAKTGLGTNRLQMPVLTQ